MLVRVEAVVSAAHAAMAMFAITVTKNSTLNCLDFVI